MILTLNYIYGYFRFLTNLTLFASIFEMTFASQLTCIVYQACATILACIRMISFRAPVYWLTNIIMCKSSFYCDDFIALCPNLLGYYLSSLPISQCPPSYSLEQEQVTIPLPSTWHVPPFLQTSSPLGEHLPFSCQSAITYLCILLIFNLAANYFRPKYCHSEFEGFDLLNSQNRPSNRRGHEQLMLLFSFG